VVKDAKNNRYLAWFAAVRKIVLGSAISAQPPQCTMSMRIEAINGDIAGRKVKFVFIKINV